VLLVGGEGPGEQVRSGERCRRSLSRRSQEWKAEREREREIGTRERGKKKGWYLHFFNSLYIIYNWMTEFIGSLS
jgi:hypothetical protein